MDKTQAIFVELKIQNKFRYACDIIEKLYDERQSVTVYCDDKKKAGSLDRQLWVWKQESFIPHVLKEKISGPIEDPVILTIDKELQVNTDTLILFDPLPSQSLDKFRYIIDFAEVYDPNRTQLSRARFKSMRDSGLYEMSFLKLGEFLSTFKFN